MFLSKAKRMETVQKSIIRQIFEAAQGDAINLGLGEIQFNTPEILREYASEIVLKETCRYTENAGLLEFRESIASYYDDLVKAEGVCVTCGAAEAIHSCFTAFINPGDEVMIANPTFLAYEASIKLNQGIPVEYKLDPAKQFKLDKEDFKEKVSDKTKIVVICNPSNPLSICLSESDMVFMTEICRNHKIMIIADEIYRELTYIPRQKSIIDLYENSISISGLSKSYCMTGWRIGWAVSRNADYIRHVTVAHQYQSTCAPYLSQKVGIKALSSEGRDTIQEIMAKLKTNYAFIKEFMAKELSGLEYLEPHSAPYLFINVDCDDTELASRLSEKGVVVIPGNAFGSMGKGWIRISYALNKPLLNKGLNILRSELN